MSNWKQQTVGEDYVAKFLNEIELVVESLHLIPVGTGYVLVVYMEKP